jgi:Uma2 family endonuclease
MIAPAQVSESTRLITGDELFQLSRRGRCELVNGRIIQMEDATGFEHGDIENNVGAELRAFVRPRHLGRVQVGGVGIYIRRNPDTVRGVDVLFISNERFAQVKSSSYLDVAPELVVEVMSPSDTWDEVTEKLQEYFSIGVRLVWVVSPQLRSVFVYRSPTAVRQFTDHDMVTGDEVLPGFAVKVADLLEA